MISCGQNRYEKNAHTTLAIYFSLFNDSSRGAALARNFLHSFKLKNAFHST